MSAVSFLLYQPFRGPLFPSTAQLAVSFLFLRSPWASPCWLSLPALVASHDSVGLWLLAFIHILAFLGSYCSCGFTRQEQELYFHISLLCPWCPCSLVGNLGYLLIKVRFQLSNNVAWLHFIRRHWQFSLGMLTQSQCCCNFGKIHMQLFYIGILEIQTPQTFMRCIIKD